MIWRRPKRRQSIENAPGPRSAIATATIPGLRKEPASYIPIVVRVSHETFRLHAVAMTLAIGVRNPKRSRTPLAATSAPRA